MHLAVNLGEHCGTGIFSGGREGRDAMRLVSYDAGSGARHGVLNGPEGDEHVHEIGTGDLLSLLESGDRWMERAQAAQSSGEGVSLNGVRLLAPLRRPPKLLALAGNYQEHVREGGVADVLKQRATPLLFLK